MVRPGTITRFTFEADELTILQVAVRDHLAIAKEERTSNNPDFPFSYQESVRELLERLDRLGEG